MHQKNNTRHTEMGVDKPEVLWINRKQTPAFFSIEKVFTTIRPFISEWKVREIYAKTRAVSIRDLFGNIRQIKKEKADVFHITGELHYAALALPRKKTVLTIHDCVFLQHPNWVKRYLLKYLWLKWPVKHAGIITTISENSKRDIIRYTGCNPDKVVVIPNPADPAYVFQPRAFNSGKPVLLQVGIKQNKNLERVIESIAGIECELVIIGKLSDEQQRLLHKYNIDYQNHVMIDEEILRKMYAGCDVLVFASWFEGFGLPVIEAQATGRVVVTSDLEPMRSVAGGGACLIDPYNVASIREGILKVIRDKEYREKLIAKGLENVKRFQPRHIAMEYMKVYNKLAQDAKG